MRIVSKVGEANVGEIIGTIIVEYGPICLRLGSTESSQSDTLSCSVTSQSQLTHAEPMDINSLSGPDLRISSVNHLGREVEQPTSSGAWYNRNVKVMS